MADAAIDYSDDFKAAGLVPVQPTAAPPAANTNLPAAAPQPALQASPAGGAPYQNPEISVTAKRLPPLPAKTPAPAPPVTDYSDDFRAAGLVPVVPAANAAAGPVGPAKVPEGAPGQGGGAPWNVGGKIVPDAPPLSPSDMEVAAAGLAKGGWDALYAAPNAANWLFNLPIKGVNAVAGTNIPTLSTDIGGEVARQVAAATGTTAPQDITPQGVGQRALYAAAQVPGQLASLAVGGGAVRQAAQTVAAATPAAAKVAGIIAGAGQTVQETPIARSIAPVAAGTAGQSAAEDLTPEPYKPYVGLLTNVGLTGLIAGLTEGIPAAFRAARNVLGRMGVGKQTFASAAGDVRATPQQADAVGQQLAKAGGPDLLTKLHAQAAAKGRIAEIDGQLADPALPAADRTALTDERRLLVPASGEMVPGARPTMAQTAVLPGGPALAETDLANIHGLEQRVRLGAKEPFIAQEGRSNSARLAALRGQATEGTPTAAVGDSVTTKLADLEAAEAAKVKAAADARVAAAAPIGGAQPPEAYGKALSDTLAASRAVQDKAMKDLAAKIDPDGTARLNIGPAQRQAAATLAGVKTEFPIVAQRIGEIDQQVGQMLRQSSEEAMPLEQRQALNTLRQERDSLQAMIDTGTTLHSDVKRVATAIANMPAVIPLQAHQALRANLSDALQTVAGNTTLGVHSPAMRQLMGIKAALDRSLAEAADRAIAKGGPKVAAGIDDAVTAAGKAAPKEFPGETITPEVAQRVVDFRNAYRDFKTTYDEGAVGNVLATDRYGSDRLPDIDKARAIFRRGVADPAAVDQYIKATGGEAPALALARDYLASELRQKGIIDPATGAVDLAKLQPWLKERSAVAAKLGGGLLDQIRTAAGAQRMYDDAVASQEAKIKAFQSGQTARVLKAVQAGSDPAQVVHSALASTDPSALADLIRQTAGNKDAREGLKRIIVDWADREMQSAVTANENENLLAATKFRKWVGRFDAPIEALFGPDGAATFRNIAEDMRAQNQRAVATPGSPTVPYGIEALKEKVSGHAPTAFSTVLAIGLGEVASHLSGLPGLPEVFGAGGGMLASALRQHAIASESELRQAALLDPSGLGRLLLQRVQPNGAMPPSLGRRILQRLQTTLLVNGIAGAQGR
jgi:hypothetical protein